MILNDDDLILPAELARNGEMMTTHFGFQHVDGRDHVHGSEVRHVVTTPCITVHRCPEIHHHRAPPTVWQPSGFGGEIRLYSRLVSGHQQDLPCLQCQRLSE